MRTTEYGRVYSYRRKNPDAALCTDIGEIIHYMGCRGSADITDGVTALARKAAKIIDSSALPKGCFSLYAAVPGENGVNIGGVYFPSCDLAVHLDGCTDAFLAAVTLGAAVDREITKASATDIALAHALDCAACAAVEAFADEMCGDFAEMFPGMRLTERFSPGYGDLPLEYQPKITEMLGAVRTIGVGVNGSLLLSPSKSVTAIVGLAKK